MADTQQAQTPQATQSSAGAAAEKYHRVRLAVPRDDVWVKRWIDEQQSPSVSIRALIRHYIETYGYGDMFSRPVEKLPRRGRPPGSGAARSEHHESVESEGAEDSEGSEGSVQTQQRRELQAHEIESGEVSETSQPEQKRPSKPTKPTMTPAQLLDGDGNDPGSSSSIGPEMLSDFD